jgi:TolB-like protein
MNRELAQEEVLTNWESKAAVKILLYERSYDRQLSDVPQLQADIANAVTSALKIQ